MARKILFYTDAFGGGGAEIVFARLASAMAEAGHDVIFAADREGPVPPRDRENLRHMVIGPAHGASLRRLADLLRREQPDASFSALGVHNLKHVVASLIAGRRRHCVLGYHGFAEAERKRLSTLSFQGAALLTRLAAKTICVSDALAEDIVRRWGGSRRRITRIYNPILAPAGPLVESREGAARLVLACGRLVPVKRFPDLVAAFAQVAPSSARLAILGEGPERPAIEAAIARHGLGGRVELPGHVDPGAWYPRAACLAVTSESESFGLTVAEALSYGLPVVSTACGGPAEILEDGRLGRLVPVGDIAAIARALTETLAAPGDPAPRLARAEAFSLDKICDAYLAIVDELAR